MRLISTALTSLILHALLLLVPVGTSPFSTFNEFPSGSSQRAARLLVTLQSMSGTSGNGLPTPPESPNKMDEQAAAATLLVEEVQKKQRQTTEKSVDRTGIEQIADIPPHYYSRHELDRPPRMADDLSEKGGALDLALREVDEHGSVVLELWISNKGTVEKSQLVSSDLSDVVINTVKSNFDLARFIPARLNKQAVHSRVTIEFLVKEKQRN